MKKKNCKLTSILRVIALPLVGSAGGWLYYLDAESCKGALHMSCVKCGRTFHMASGNAALFAKHLAQSEQFTLDAADTVLYGICADCREE